MALRKIPSALVALGWAILLALSVYNNILPVTSYMDVKRVYVADTFPGVPPTMDVDRVILRDFVAEWRVDVEKVRESGRHSLVCTASGGGSYSTDTDVPDDLDLDWWTYPEKCTPTQPGLYRLETVWTVIISDNLKKNLRVLSNNFSVLPQP